MGAVIQRFGRNKRPLKFWGLMGPLFASAAVRRELTTLRDEPEHDEWFVAVSGKGDVVTFGCLRITGDDAPAELCHHWVRPADREAAHEAAINAAMLARAKELQVSSVFVIAAPDAAKALSKDGWVQGAARGKYVRMEKTL